MENSTAFYLLDPDDGTWVNEEDSIVYNVMNMWLNLSPALARLGDDDDKSSEDVEIKPFRFKLGDHEFCFTKAKDCNSNEINRLFLVVNEPKFSDRVASVEMPIINDVNREMVFDMLANREQSYLIEQMKRAISDDERAGLEITDSGLGFCDKEVTVIFKDGMKLKIFASEFGGLHFEK